MKSGKLRFFAVASLIALPAVWHSAIIGAEEPERLIVKCLRPCAAAVAAVAALGGETTQTYDNVDAIAVSVPSNRVGDLTLVLGVDAVRKDVVVMLPPSGAIEADSALDAQPIEGDALSEFVRAQPDNYNYNNGLTGAASLHAAGSQGQNVIVGLIDSGTAIAATALAGTVMGGENFVPASQDPVASATSRFNDWHGTSTADMIAAHANFAFATTSTLVRSVLLNAPGSAINCPNAAFPGCPAGTSVIPMIGTAPAAKIYALKVFPSRGGGSPESRIIAAMDRAITLRRNFNDGVPSVPVAGLGTENSPFKYDSLNIKVVNMSLGGPTLFAGGDIEDQLTIAMLEVGITLATSAGNDGFAAMTGGSPGTGIGSLTAAASNTPAHERILRDNQFGFGIGQLYRPFNEVQTAYFSSRGPTADGRLDPDISANGFASYTNVFAAVVGNVLVSCGAPGVPASACLSRIVFASGTSFASPTVAGAAALLRQAVPNASAIQTRNALIRGANPTLIGDGSGRIDQGAGFLDVPAALALLNAGVIEDELPAKKADDGDDDPDDVGAGGKSVTANLLKLGIRPVKFVKDKFTSDVKDLTPGQVAHFFVPSDIFTDRLVVKITNIVPELPPAGQNALFGDDLFVMGVDAPTSFAVHRIENPPGSEGLFVNADSTFTIDNPQTGLVRLALQGDWTNAGKISAKVTIERVRRPSNVPSATGQIKQADIIPFHVNVPAAAQAVFELFWQQNWGRYPTNDLDMLVVDPNGNLLLTAGIPPGASLNSPERAVVANPVAGEWTVLVNGFTIQQHGSPSGRDDNDLFTLMVTADGRRLKVNK